MYATFINEDGYEFSQNYNVKMNINRFTKRQNKNDFQPLPQFSYLLDSATPRQKTSCGCQIREKVGKNNLHLTDSVNYVWLKPFCKHYLIIITLQS